MKRTRPSSMPRAFECPSSLADAVAPVNIPSDESDLGTAAHAALALAVQGVDPDIAAIAKEHGVDADDLAPLVNYGRKAWGELRQLFPGVRVEAELDSDLGNGTTDLLSIARSVGHERLDVTGDDLIVIGDWKSGRNRRSHRRQVQAYAYGARYSFGMPKSGVITAIVVWLRFAEFEVLHFTDADLDAFRLDYLDLDRDIGKRFAPGEYCTGCHRQLECPARDAFVRSAGTALVAADSSVITPEKLAELYPQAQMLEKAIDAYRAALKLSLASGPLPIGNGKQLELVESRRSIIDARAAWPVLEANGFDDSDIARTVSMSKGEIESVAAEKAPPREKGKHKAAIMSALEKAGAVQQSTFTKIQQTKIQGA